MTAYAKRSLEDSPNSRYIVVGFKEGTHCAVVQRVRPRNKCHTANPFEAQSFLAYEDAQEAIAKAKQEEL